MLQEAAANIHPNLKAVLLTILQKTLCLRDERYHSCDELLTDIESALYYVIPIEISDRGKAGKKWILSDVEHFFSKSHEKNVMLTLQHHLYTHPLYIRQSSTDALNVLIVGFDMYSQKFLDQVLQIAQMPKIVLNIEVIYDNPQEKELYLYQRPELRNFFNVDGSLDEVDDNYGTVKFTNYSLSEENLNILIKNISEKQSQTVSDYIFISSGRDKLNLLIAKSLNIKSPINIVWEGTQHISQKKLGTITPVYISEDISQLPFRKELERMAFNVHLIWNKNLNVDYNSVRCEYLKPYNRYSCISFIVAMKYKLHGLGIDLDKVGTKRAAYEYQRYISDNTEQKNILSCFEHRRWVTEKICLGYCKITDLEYCATGLTKDEKKKKHVCILRSTPDTPLKSKKWYRITQKQPIKEKWDNPRPQDLAKLDDLDRMSVELHLMFKKHAKLEQENDLLNGQLILDLRKQTEYDSDCVVALQELLTCMKDIWDGNIDQCNRYEGLKQKFLKTVKKSNVLYDRNKHSINKLWGALQDKFYPIFASMLYRDYKLDDIKLINGIPFILTYSESIYMAIPYSTGTNNDIFSNLAAATVINPAKILYFAYCSNQKDLAKIEQTLTYIIQYMNKKPIRAKIEFIIGFTIRSGICNNSEIEHKLKQSSGGRVKRVSLVAAESPKEFATILKEYLITRNKRKSNFLIEFNNTLLAGLLDGLNLYEQLPSYSYNPTLMEFSVHHDADMITYIQKEPYITATDMFSLKEASSETSNKPEFFADYKKLWQLYKESTVAWKNVCHILGEYSEKNDKIVYFRRCSGEPQLSQYRYIIPFECKRTTEHIISALISEKIIEKSSSIHYLTTHSCEVIIDDLSGNQIPFNILFSKVYILMQEDYLRCDVDSEYHVVKVFYNNLVVTNLDSTSFHSKEYDIIEHLGKSEIGYLTNLFVDKVSKKISFSFATKQIKDLLTIEGRILEIYLYHKVIETGAFDDVRSGLEIDWSHSLAKNEFDCIICKGFSSLFVECKATRKLKRDYYDKLAMLVQNFGINAKAVIVADTIDTPETKADNERLRLYGLEQGVITISERIDIENIGMKLIGLIKNNS